MPNRLVRRAHAAHISTFAWTMACVSPRRAMKLFRGAPVQIHFGKAANVRSFVRMVSWEKQEIPGPLASFCVALHACHHLHKTNLALRSPSRYQLGHDDLPIPKWRILLLWTGQLIDQCMRFQHTREHSSISRPSWKSNIQSNVRLHFTQ